MILTLGKNDPKVTNFRKLVYQKDLKLPLELMDKTYTELKNIINPSTDTEFELFENAWKMSNTKWMKENIDCVWLLDKIAISCGVDYDCSRYRGAYLTYTLKEKRSIHRSLHFKEFGFFFMQSLRAIELGKEEIFLTVYEYNRRMSAQIRAFKHKGYADIAGNILHQELDYKGIEFINDCNQHVFSIDFKKLWKKYDKDLMEMTNKETGKVIAKFPKEPRRYPDVVKIQSEIDVSKLYQEYKEFNNNENYILSRRKYFKISPSLNIIISNYLGFKNSVYSGVSLNKKDSIELKKNVGPYTRKFLNQFPSACRINYITTRKGWKTKQHIDHKDYTTQGFRIIVPFDSMKITFDEKREYILSPNNIYFVNVCIPHVGEHFSEKKERAGILFKLQDDSAIWQAYFSA